MKLTGGTRDLNCPAEDCPTDQAYLADSDHQAVIDGRPSRFSCRSFCYCRAEWLTVCSHQLDLPADPYTANFRLTLCP